MDGVSECWYIKFLSIDGEWSINHHLDSTFNEKKIPTNYIGFVIRRTIFEQHQIASCYLTREIYSAYLGVKKSKTFLNVSETCILSNMNKYLDNIDEFCLFDSMGRSFYVPLLTTSDVFSSFEQLHDSLKETIKNKEKKLIYKK